MNLFEDLENPLQNLLPYDGTVHYYGKILNDSDARKYFDVLLGSIAWTNDEAVIFGKRIISRRKVAWYGDDFFQYRYSGTVKRAMLWTEDLLFLKNLVEEKSGETYNSCLLNLYHDGSEGMAYHSDAEKDLEENAAIASLSLGATRKFSFKHRETKERKDFILEPGSLLVMKGQTQKFWLHRLPPTVKVSSPRINLTFRTISLK